MAPQTSVELPAGKISSNKEQALTPTQVQVDDQVYDAKSLASIHPGGELFVKSFAGRDATEAFLSYHRRSFPHARMTKSLVGTAKPLKDSEADEDFLELCKIVEQVLPRNKSFAPFSYYVKVAIIFGAAFGLEFYMHYTAQYPWYLTGLLGWVFALIGLNIQHDANHGAISPNAWVNRVLGLGQNWIGGSAVDWIHQHVVQHHINPNDVHNDPDIVGNDLLRLNPLMPKNASQTFQHIYLFVLLGFFGFTYIGDSLKHNLEGFHKTAYSELIKTNRIFESATILSFAFRWLVVPVLQQPSVYTLLNIAPLFIVGGYYLSFFFVISHNFEGAHLFHPEYTSKVDQSFLRKQVLSGSNVGGSLLCTLNGGLNYQIEHHLFPRIQHTHYPTIAPVVRQYCLSKGIPYVHFPSIQENVASCARHLYQLGTGGGPSNYVNAQGRKGQQ